MIGLVLAAAGSGTRFGSEIPKQFAQVEGTPLFLHALKPFLPFCQQAVIVLAEDRIPHWAGCLDGLDSPCGLHMTAGGARRQDSVYRGLRCLNEDVRTVLVHDAARPYCSAGLIARVIDGAQKHSACIPLLPLADTVKQVERGRVTRTLDRSRLGLAQTPQGFDRHILLRAFQKAEREGIQGTDESSLVERLGVDVYTVPGEAGNLKITWKEDL